MLHRAILGSFERFIGILIEHYAGRLPAVAGAGAGGGRHHHQRGGRLRRARCWRAAAAGLRAEADLRNEKIGYKVREHSLAKVPVMLVVGGRGSREDTVAIRRLGSQAQETVALQDAVAKLEN